MTANLSICPDVDGATATIDIIAYRHHTRWLELCEDNPVEDVREWKNDFKGHVKETLVTDWEAKMDGDSGSDENSIIALNSCRFCKICIKTPHSPDMLYGKNAG